VGVSSDFTRLEQPPERLTSSAGQLASLLGGIAAAARAVDQGLGDAGLAGIDDDAGQFELLEGDDSSNDDDDDDDDGDGDGDGDGEDADAMEEDGEDGEDGEADGY
jgi:hypothetical protein